LILGCINLDKQATVNSLRNLGSGWHEDLDQLNIQFETQISREAFIEGSKFIPNASADEILQAWSAIY
jgi:hypothetical protein